MDEIKHKLQSLCSLLEDNLANFERIKRDHFDLEEIRESLNNFKFGMLQMIDDRVAFLTKQQIKIINSQLDGIKDLIQNLEDKFNIQLDSLTSSISDVEKLLESKIGYCQGVRDPQFNGLVRQVAQIENLIRGKEIRKKRFNENILNTTLKIVLTVVITVAIAAVIGLIDQLFSLGFMDYIKLVTSPAL